MNILIIGGTRNIGHFLVHELIEAGHQVTVFNRGRTPDQLPEPVERLRGDRTVPEQLDRALSNRHFDAVVDTALYKGDEADTISRLLDGRVGHYIFLSTGQVYLVREGLERPFSEADYEGRLMPAPKANTYSYEEWLYGVDKRRAEDTLMRAHARTGFPVTTLRLPMVNSERDHFNRLYGYYLRMKDGGPILVPETPGHSLRHVYAGDVVRAIRLIIESGAGKGQAYNISQDETVPLEAFLATVGQIMGISPRIAQFKRSALEASGFLPDCSPFSERWMSELTNARSKAELGLTYTPLADYLARIIAHFEANPLQKPASYHRRQAEIAFATQD